MKKYALSIFAVVIAFGMSAFTESKKTVDTLYYKDGNSFFEFTGTACPADNQIQCQADQPGVGVRPIYTAPNDLSPYLTRQ